MGRIVAHIDDAGTARYDGQDVTVRAASGQEVALYWDAADEMWIGGQTFYTMRQLDNVGMRGFGYPSLQENPVLQTNATQWGFQIHEIANPGALVNAGLHLQEHLSVEMGNPSGSTAPSIALNYYELFDGDSFLSPTPANFGVPVIGDLNPDVYKWYSSGWQNSPASDPAAGGHWYPEIYSNGGAAINFRNFCARHRWAAGPGLGGLGSSEQASRYPDLDFVLSWHEARNVAAVDNGTVAQWADYSGRGRALKQSNASKRPVVRRDAPGAIRHVRFDGVNDLLATSILPAVQPWTVFLAIRQNSGGGTQQVWAGGSSPGAPLLYRYDATDQVSVWLGGSDLTYHRGSPWPSPWMVWSVVCDGASTSVWEGTTEVATGNAGSTGLTGLYLGNNAIETLPAKIDVAELIFAASAPGDTARAAMVNTIKTRLGIS